MPTFIALLSESNVLICMEWTCCCCMVTVCHTGYWQWVLYQHQCTAVDSDTENWPVSAWQWERQCPSTLCYCGGTETDYTRPRQAVCSLYLL